MKEKNCNLQCVFYLFFRLAFDYSSSPFHTSHYEAFFFKTQEFPKFTWCQKLLSIRLGQESSVDATTVNF